MALIKKVNGVQPKWGSNCFFAENATLTGDIIMGDDCSVWFNAVVRGDVHSIRIGNNVNIQDGAVVHTAAQRAQIVPDQLTASLTLDASALIDPAKDAEVVFKAAIFDQIAELGSAAIEAKE